jgi:hypothetical protein
MPRPIWQWLHPRMASRLGADEKRVLELVSRKKQLHPRELEEHLGRAREVNAWGGYSKATTRILHSLHYRGLLRVSGRENGVRVYQVISNRENAAVAIDPRDRLKRLILLLAKILAPVPERSLRAALQHLAHAAPALEGRHAVLSGLIDSGELASAEVESLRYLWPAGRLAGKKPAEVVRVLAPFDPLVWDRYRFEHFWGWAYRFEAYTPVAKRKLGYYAMPLLWRDEVVGWVNVSRGRKGGLDVERGFAKSMPTERSFQAEFDTEIERLSRFLGIQNN